MFVGMEWRKDIPHLHNSICGCTSGTDGEDDAIRSSKLLKVNIRSSGRSLELHVHPSGKDTQRVGDFYGIAI